MPYLIAFLLILLPLSLSSGPLPLKERLLYRITYSGWLTLGYAEMRILGQTQTQGVQCYELETKTWAADWLSEIYPVDDLIQSHWDPALRRSLWHSKRIHEGKIQQSYVVTFDYKKKLARWKQKGFSPQTSGNRAEGVTPRIPNIFQDPLSSVYFARTWGGESKPGMKFNLEVFDDLGIANIEMEVLNNEKIDLRLQGRRVTLDAQRIEPRFSSTGLFHRRSNRLFLWVGRGKQRLPLRIVSEIAIGSIKAELIEAQPGL